MTTGSTVICGDALAELRKLPAGAVNTCVTSPPYWGLRDYGVEGQLGLERTPEEYVERMVGVFREVRRILRPDGVLFLNLGDSYSVGTNDAKSFRRDRAQVNHVRRRAPSCDSDDIIPQDCPLRDSIWSRPCDGCQAASVLRSLHNGRPDASRLDGDSRDPSLERMESAPAHPPTSGSSGRTRIPRSDDATRDQRRSGDRVAGRLPASRGSTPDGSSPRRQCECLRSDSHGSDHGEPCSSSFDAREFSRTDEHKHGIGETFSSSGSHIGIDRSACPYRHSTMPYHDVKLKHKDLVGIPWRVAFALQADGWYLRSDIIWSKPNPMPESVTDRPTKSHEYIFLLAKSERYYYDSEAIKEPVAVSQVGRVREDIVGGKSYLERGQHSRGGVYRSGNKERKAATERGCPREGVCGSVPWEDDGHGRNKRTVWTVTTKPFKDAHFAVFPPDLIKPCILAGCPKGGTVLDPFGGSGTTGLVAKECGCEYVLIELNPDYCDMSHKRIRQEVFDF